MSRQELDDQYRIAITERIARFTVGIAGERNTVVGTGTLVKVGGERTILTAAHVIGASRPDDLRFWLRPPAPLKEKAARSTSDAEVGKYTAGIHLPIIEIAKDDKVDIAVLRVHESFDLPDGPDVYDAFSSREFIDWEDGRLEGLTLVLMGFPTDNSRLVNTIGNRQFHFLGAASFLSEYSVELNRSVWRRLSSSFSDLKDFVFEYHGYSEQIGPRGFSGAGVWIPAADPAKKIWAPDPILIGVVHTHVPKLGLLVATKLPSIIHISSNSNEA
jgi:hypothetical protein